jgi:hypothetical protein
MTGWHALGPGLPGPVAALATYHGDLVAAGVSWTARDSLYVSRWDGDEWHRMGRQVPLALGVEAKALCVYKDELYFAGKFDQVGDSVVHSIARWDGVSWRPVGDGFQAVIVALHVYDGRLLAGGYFWGDGGPNRETGIRAWDGEVWRATPSMIGSVVRFCDFQGDLVASWVFDYQDEDSTNIRRWTGSSWQPLDERQRVPYYANSMVAFRGDLVVGGPWYMRMFDAYFIARYDGVGWYPLGNGVTDAVNDMIVYNSDLVATGNFIKADDRVVNRLARWNGSRWDPVGSGYGLDRWGQCLAVWDGGLIVGGGFTTAGSSRDTVNYIARWDE